MQLDKAYQEKLLHDALKDKDASIRTYAADLAAKLGYKALVSEILALYKTAVGEDEKASYCQTITSLGTA